jgi:hypothetical protein
MDDELPAFSTADFEALRDRLMVDDPAELWLTTAKGRRIRLSPEEVREVMADYRRRMRETADG